MHVTLLVQAVVTSSWLLLSSARVKPTPCDGGRSEGGKWFDGCRWCVCGRLGQVCSSHRCSHLVSLVPACPQVGSRWLDGCYYCQCLHHGIECSLDDVCAPLLRKEHIPANVLSSQSCFDELGNRCVCGVDGIPSCTAQVIERHPDGAITIQLQPSLPVQPTLLSPRVAPSYSFPRSPHNDRDLINRSKQPNYLVDPLNIHNKIFRHEKQKRQSHNLVKRNSRRIHRHSWKSYNSLDDDLSILKNEHSTSHSTVLLNEILNPELNNIYKRSHEIRRHAKLTNLLNRISPKPSPNYRKRHARNGHTHLHVDWADSQESGSDSNRRHHKVHGLERPVGATQTWDDEVEEDDNRPGFGEKWPIQDNYLKDQPSNTHKPLSLLVVSDNLCRLGVRWYGGSLRCYCGRQGSITCGDPALVAPRVDGFRVEDGDCQEGQEWEDNYCSLCQCVMAGLVVCQRSPSCPLPFLINPRSLSHSEDSRRQGPGAVMGEFSGLAVSLDGCHPTDLDCSATNSGGSGSLKDNTDLDLQTPGIISDLSSETTQPLHIDSPLESMSLTKQETKDSLDYSTMNSIDSMADLTSSVASPTTSPLDFFLTNLTLRQPDESPETEDEELVSSKRQTSGSQRQCVPGSRFRRGCRDCTCNANGVESCSTTRCPQPGVPNRSNSVTTSVTLGPDGRPMQRPPQEAYYSRTGPIDLSPPLVSCGNFSVGQTYYDECNTCQCLPEGPICTNMNCRL